MLAVAGVFVGYPTALGVAVVAAVAVACVVDRRVLQTGLRLGLVATIVFSSAVVGAVVAWSSDWVNGFQMAGATLLRLVVFVILTAVLARNVNAEHLLRITRRLGLERLGLILGLALNVMSHLVDATRQVVLAWRVRRGTGHGSAPSLFALAEVLLAHVARIADDAAAAAALRGHGALLHRPMAVSSATPVIVATGSPGSGKTTTLLSIIRRLQASGCRVVGIVQPAKMENGEKVGFRICDVLTGEETDLAHRVDRGSGEHGTRFRFLATGFEFAERALSRTRSGDVLVVDELGPLELRAQGHMRAVLKAIRVAGLLAVVVVVRAQLVPALLAALEADDAVVIDVSGEVGEKDLEQALVGKIGHFGEG
jgi:nucleoside-triphosphatase